MSFEVMIMNRIALTLFSFLLLAAAGCAPRVNIITGTTIGLKATPGDGNVRPPQITFAYKRAEVAFVPTKGEKAKRNDSSSATGVDAFSTLAAFFFETRWFGNTEIASFIATGFAARNIQTEGPEFNDAFAKATLGDVSPAIKTRQDALFRDWAPLTEDQAKRVLDLAGYPVKPNKKAKNSLQDYLLTAETDSVLMKFEWAFSRLR